MNESEILRTINKQIDGEITQTEKETLDQILNSDEEIRQQFENMQKTIDAVENIPEIDPPASLTNDILSKIDPHRYQKPDPLWQRLSVAISDFIAPRRRVAMAFVSGLVIGGCCIGLFSNYESISTTDLTGTIGADQGNNIQHYTMQSAIIKGEFSLEKLPSGLICQAKVNTEQPFVMQIEFDSPGYYLVEYESVSGEPVFIQSASGQIQLTANSGTELKLIFNGKDARDEKLSLIITSQEETLKKTILF
jgi:hypothetical protein